MNKTLTVNKSGIAENITELVGQTPMLHLRRIAPEGGADIFAKLEYLNPGGSVKDRAAIGMIQRAEQEGRLEPGGTILEATAGNTGIGLALIGVSKGYRVVVCVPEKFAEEKVKVMKALGAEVLRTPDADGMQGAIKKVKELSTTIPGSFTALQFENPSNPDFHYQTTAAEIYEQMEGRVDAIVIGVGTGGTFSGIARFMKERSPAIHCVAVETEGSVLQGGQPKPHKVEGIGSRFLPPYRLRASWEKGSTWSRSFLIPPSDICQRTFLRAESKVASSIPARKQLFHQYETGSRKSNLKT
jgi:cysteine synthase